MGIKIHHTRALIEFLPIEFRIPVAIPSAPMDSVFPWQPSEAKVSYSRSPAWYVNVAAVSWNSSFRLLEDERKRKAEADGIRRTP
jgi:hypothetical protein